MAKPEDQSARELLAQERRRKCRHKSGPPNTERPSRVRRSQSAMTPSTSALAALLLLLRASADAFFVFPRHPLLYSFSLTGNRRPRNDAAAVPLRAAPKRLEENVDGVLYVNDKCINCAACAGFAPDVFSRSPTDRYHAVHTQPSSDDAKQLDRSRAALAACPVAAIRVTTSAQLNHANNGERLSEDDERLARLLAISPKANGLEVPFPRPIVDTEGGGSDDDGAGAYYVGYHDEKSFGAVPYLAVGADHKGKRVSVMVDTPKFTPAAVRAVTSLSGDSGPDYLLLTHVDDVAQHNKWVEEFPDLKRIFHSGDLGKNNWLNDRTLGDVEVLLKGTLDEDEDEDEDGTDEGRLFRMWTLDGDDVTHLDDVEGDFVVLHTPGHSPGSISLLFRPGTQKEGGEGAGGAGRRRGVLFTGDTYAYSTRNGGGMSGFPRYGNNLHVQERTLRRFGLVSDMWDVVAPGHGHARIYDDDVVEEEDDEDGKRRRRKVEEIEGAIEGFAPYRKRFAPL